MILRVDESMILIGSDARCALLRGFESNSREVSDLRKEIGEDKVRSCEEIVRAGIDVAFDASEDQKLILYYVANQELQKLLSIKEGSRKSQDKKEIEYLSLLIAQLANKQTPSR